MDTAEKTGPTGRRTGGRWSLAWLAMVWERLWPALLPTLLVVAVFTGVSVLSLWSALPGLVHLVFLAAFLCAFCVALVAGLRTFSFPQRNEVNRRIEQESDLPHRPLETLEDQASQANATGEIFWRLHQERAQEAARQAHGIVPRPDMPRRDPFALRGAIGLFLAVALAIAGSWNFDQFARAFDPKFESAAAALIVDAWVVPPEYTGEAPIFLSGNISMAASESADAELVTVPEGSIFTLRIQGARGVPEIYLQASSADQAETARAVPIDGVEGGYELIHTLDRNISIEVAKGAGEPFDWRFLVRHDTPPAVQFSERVGVTNRLSLRFVYEAEDDYGVEGIEAVIALDTNEDAVGPIRLVLPLRGLSPKMVTGQAFRDFTPHAFAGLPVVITLRAVDARGQEGLSETIAMVMPERVFTNPVARALIEQRKILTISPEKSDQVARVLEAITLYPAGLFETVAPILGISAAAWELRTSDTPGGRSRVTELLWEIALSLEDGDLSLALSELRGAQQALQEALERGASDEEIKQLTQDLREAMNRYLEAMTAQAMERMQNSPQSFSGQALDPENMVRSDELQRMLDTIENMAQSGARDAAQQMLSELQNMLENLQAGIPQQMDPSQAMMGEALKELSDLIARQQQLMDQTLQDSQGMQNGQRNGNRQPGDQPGQRAQGGRQPGEGDGLAQAQDALRRALGNLMGQLGEADADIPNALGRAEQAMRQSRNSLRQGQSGQALGPQRNALDQMREGAQSLAQQLMNAMRQNQPGSGEGDATAQGDGMGGNDRDPLGRPRAQSGADTGDSVKVPGKRSVQTVREILRELRRRSSERQRPKDEFDYLNRLLERF